jgi:hypothetical protein
MPAKFHSTEIRDLKRLPPTEDPMVHNFHDINEPIKIGNTTIQPFEVFHPDPCLAYKIEHHGKVFVFCTDHELRRDAEADNPLQIASLEAEQRLIEQSMDADVLYRDGHQGIGSAFGVSRLDWGHSCIEDVMDMAEKCRVGHTYVGHHDPNRTWAEKNWIDETQARRKGNRQKRRPYPSYRFLFSGCGTGYWLEPLAVGDIKIAAPMHDIGKIGIPDIILKKPGRLTDAEFSVMRTHTTIGKEMLSDSTVPILHIASEIAGSHHEYWNGDGYPEGLKGDSITVSARIISIVDVYDALVHRRVYKTAFEENVALEMMRGLVGIQFDPELFAVFIDNLEEMRDIRNAVIDL